MDSHEDTDLSAKILEALKLVHQNVDNLVEIQRLTGQLISGILDMKDLVNSLESKHSSLSDARNTVQEVIQILRCQTLVNKEMLDCFATSQYINMQVLCWNHPVLDQVSCTSSGTQVTTDSCSDTSYAESNQGHLALSGHQSFDSCSSDASLGQQGDSCSSFADNISEDMQNHVQNQSFESSTSSILFDLTTGLATSPNCTRDEPSFKHDFLADANDSDVTVDGDISTDSDATVDGTYSTV